MTLNILYPASSEVPAQYTLDSDPTVFAWGGTNAAANSILIRTDVPSTYYKSGPLKTNWTLVGSGGGGGGGLTVVQEEGAPIGPGPFTTMNFVGQGITAVDNAGVAQVTVPSAQQSFPDIIDTATVRVQIGNSAPNNVGCKTIIGTPSGPPHPLDPMLRVESDVGGTGADSFIIRDAGLGTLVRTRCDPSIGGSVTFQTGLSVVTYGLSGVSPNALVGTVNNHTWGGGLLQFQPAAPLTVTGIALTVPAKNLNPLPMGMIQNFGPASVTFTHEDVASLEANRFRLPGGAPFVLPAGGGCIVLYSSVPVSGGQRWMIMGAS